MKRIIFSFDDGRSDNFENAIPILDNYGFKCTLNVVSDYIENPDEYMRKSFKDVLPMTVEQVKICANNGHEIALHGHTHKNDATDIKNNIVKLNSWGICPEKFGFASPYSYFLNDNCPNISEMLNSGEISYIRTGIQTNRKSLLYKALLWLETKTHNNFLFWIINRENVIINSQNDVFNSVTIRSCTKPSQIKYLISKMPDNSSVIFMFHSISNDVKNMWFWKVDYFKEICDYLNNGKDICVTTTSQLAK